MLFPYYEVSYGTIWKPKWSKKQILLPVKIGESFVKSHIRIASFVILLGVAMSFPHFCHAAEESLKIHPLHYISTDTCFALSSGNSVFDFVSWTWFNSVMPLPTSPLIIRRGERCTFSGCDINVALTPTCLDA